MSDDVKDFRYYADKAEELLGHINADCTAEDINAMAAVAAVLAQLATAAPAGRSLGMCPGRLFPVPPNGEFANCVLGEGHEGDHLNRRGVYFRG